LSLKNGRSKVEAGPVIPGINRVLDDAEAQETLPTLFSLLNPAFKDDKCVRLGGTLRLRVIGGYYVVTVSCPTEEKQATVVVTSLVPLVTALETALRDPMCVWLDDFEKQKRARREAKG
jgi:hypothetical protein